MPATIARSIRPLLLAGLPLAALALASGCRKDAPQDAIVGDQATPALVFVKTEAEETLNRTWGGGNLYKLAPIAPDGAVTPITNFNGASISDPCVSWDGERILFSMRAPGESDRNIWEIGADGTGLRRVTSGGGHDFDPLYLPDGAIVFTSSRAGEMDEYNHSPAEHLYACDANGGNIERISFNQSDDFDPAMLADGHIIYTRWEHFGTFNRFPLFFTNPDGTGTFHMYGPHDRNFFHAQPTPDGRLIAVESTRVNEDAGPIVVIKLENGPADPAPGPDSDYWDVLTPDVNTDGAPWAYGAFKYPFPLGNNRYIASYTLPAAEDEQADYGLYTFTLSQTGAGTAEDPATLSLDALSFLYNDPATNEYDAQLLWPREKPIVIPRAVDSSRDSGTFLAHDVFNRSLQDDQEVPLRGVTPVPQIAVFASRPTQAGETNDFSANSFEKRAFLGYAPVQPDGSFKIEVPADTPISFATLDEHGRGFVVKRTWLYARPGEAVNQCTGCHTDRERVTDPPTNPFPMADMLPATDLNLDPEDYEVINYLDDIGPIVEAKCVACHQVTVSAPGDTLWAPAGLDLGAQPDTLEMGQIFPRGYVNLSGESEHLEDQVVIPGFPRRSTLIDATEGLGSWEGRGRHPVGANTLTDRERELFRLWVMLGAQYR